MLFYPQGICDKILQVDSSRLTYMPRSGRLPRVIDGRSGQGINLSIRTEIRHKIIEPIGE